MSVETGEDRVRDIDEERSRRISRSLVDLENQLWHKRFGSLEGDQNFTREAPKLAQAGEALSEALARSPESPELAARALANLEVSLAAIRSSKRGGLLVQLGRVLAEADDLHGREAVKKYGSKIGGKSDHAVKEGEGRIAA